MSEELARWKLRVTARGDASVMARVPERFQYLHVLSCRVVVESAYDNTLHIEVDVLGLPEVQMKPTLITLLFLALSPKGTVV